MTPAVHQQALRISFLFFYNICAGVAPDLSPHYHHILGEYRARNPLSLLGEPGTQVTADSCFNPQEDVPSEAPVLTHCKHLSILIHTGKGGRGKEG
jgi:hypothetical protein